MAQPFWKNSLVFSCRVKYTFLSDSEIPLLDIYPREMKNVCPRKALDMNVHGSFTHNNHNLETNYMSIKWQSDKQIVAYLYHGTLLSIKEE